jgi:hypothetical protein
MPTSFELKEKRNLYQKPNISTADKIPKPGKCL